jgi:hypothetical protein
MRQLKSVYLTLLRDSDALSSGWAIPFASGGLSDLTLCCQNFSHVGDLDAILAPHSDTLKSLTLFGLPQYALGLTGYEMPRGPKYKLNRLETLMLSGNPAGEAYLRRFSDCPIKFLKVRNLALPDRQPVTNGQWCVLAEALLLG